MANRYPVPFYIPGTFTVDSLSVPMEYLRMNAIQDIFRQFNRYL